MIVILCAAILFLFQVVIVRPHLAKLYGDITQLEKTAHNEKQKKKKKKR